MSKDVVDIIEGPSLEDLLKSLTTHGAGTKHVVNFVLKGMKVTAVVYSIADTGTIDVTDAKSQIYDVRLNYTPVGGNGYGQAIATFYIDTKQWGRWTFLPEY